MAETGGESAEKQSAEVTADTIKYEPIKTEMTLEELNERRQQLVDSKTEDYVCADGTVIPNVYVKLRSLLDTYGNGVGSQVHDASYTEAVSYTHLDVYKRQGSFREVERLTEHLEFPERFEHVTLLFLCPSMTHCRATVSLFHVMP